MDLVQVLDQLPEVEDENLIVGINSLDDAGVYKLTDSLAIVNTVDFFTPIVDDPYAFGAIAVANALSDVYTMGAVPKTAMNLVCFPKNELPMQVLADILKGGMDKMMEARVTLVGGHSIDDPELKYGVAVTGVVHPDRVLTNSGARVGDVLILTKPLGVGVITTGIKLGKVAANTAEAACQSMTKLNRAASEIMLKHQTHACTDITGFGLLGHAREVAEGSGVALEIQASKVPVLDGTLDLVSDGVFTGAWAANKEFLAEKIAFNNDVSQETRQILMEAETSGGLLIAVAETEPDALLNELRDSGITSANVIGRVVPEPRGKVVVV